MSYIRQVLTHAASTSLSFWGILLTLMLGSILKTVGLIYLDAGTVSLYLHEFAVAYVGFDFILVAALLVLTGYYTLLFDRRHGYGCVPVCASALLVLTGLIFMADLNEAIGIHGLFVYKYGAFVLFNISFWTVASRFVPIRLDSHKFLSIFCVELLAFLGGGFFVYTSSITSFGALVTGLFFLLGFLAVLKILIYINPVPSETFIKKVGGVQDISGLKLMRTIFALAFVYMMSKGLIDYAFYAELITRSQVLNLIGLLWMAFGGIGLVTIFILYRIRYLYAGLLGMIVMCGGLIIAASGVMVESFWLIFAGLLVFLLCSYFYLTPYLSMLPRPLAIGKSVRIKQRRLLVLEPLGFLAAALIIYYIGTPTVLGLLLVFVGLTLLFYVLLAAKLYSKILMDSFERRQWRGGPLMIASPSILAYITEGLKSQDPDEALYFLRMLGMSKHPSYHKNLLKMVKHPSPIVRAFVLDRMDQLRQQNFFYKTVENVFLKDESNEVRQKALSLLLRYDFDKDPATCIDKYVMMLNDKSVQIGILTGLLQLGGDAALLAMDGLQRMAFSKRSAQNIEALKIIEQVPLAGLVRLVLPLMKHPEMDVVRQALHTAGAMKHPQLLPYVFEALDDLDLQEDALVALRAYGKHAFPPLEKMLHSTQTPALRQKILILFLNALGSGEGKQILIRAMSMENQKLRKVVIHSLIDSSIVWIHKSKKALLMAGINKDISRIHFEEHFIETQTDAPTHETQEAFQFLRRAFMEDMVDTRELILLQLYLLKSHPLFSKAIRILLSDKTNQYMAALGVVQDFLPSKLYHQIKPIALMPMLPKKALPDRVVMEEQAVETLSHLLMKPPFVLPDWVKATALYALRKLGYEEGKGAVISCLNDKNPLVLEAAIWALVRLEKDEKELHKLLLTLPTTQLVGLSLEQILES